MLLDYTKAVKKGKRGKGRANTNSNNVTLYVCHPTTIHYTVSVKCSSPVWRQHYSCMCPEMFLMASVMTGSVLLHLPQQSTFMFTVWHDST